MKRSLSIFIIVLMFLSLLGCSKNTEAASSVSDEEMKGSFIALEVGKLSDIADGGKHLSEYELWSRDIYVDEEVQKDITFTFDGVQYTGTYDYSYVTLGDAYTTDHYTYTSDSYTDFYSIRSDTGEVVNIVRGLMFKDEQTAITETKSIEKCQIVANGIVESYIDIREYTIDAEEINNKYKYSYIRYVNDVETIDKVEITLLKNGELAAFSRTGIGMVGNEDKTSISKLSKELVSPESDNVMLAKLKTIYSEGIKYEIKGKKLVVLENGQMGLLYDISTMNLLCVEDGEEMWISGGTNILVTME